MSQERAAANSYDHLLHTPAHADQTCVAARSRAVGPRPRTFCFFEPFCFLAGLGLSSPSGVMGPPFSSAGRFLLFFAEPSTAWVHEDGRSAEQSQAEPASWLQQPHGAAGRSTNELSLK